MSKHTAIVIGAGSGGIVAASTAAIVHADAPWLAFLDHDDRLHPAALLALEALVVVTGRPLLQL